MVSSHRILVGDVRDRLAELDAGSAHCVVTSPPYWGLRDYGVEGQIGLEETPEEWAAGLVGVFREVRRVLRDDGTLWLNIGDSYATHPGQQGNGQMRGRGICGQRIGMNTHRGSGVKQKDLIGQPWLLAFALRADGWYLRSEIIWHKPNPMPESCTDRPTKSHEQLFLLSKSPRYYYNADAVRTEHAPKSLTVKTTPYKDNAPANDGGANLNKWLSEPGRGRQLNPAGASLRDVWTIATHAYPGAHFATFPPKLVEPCIRAGSPDRGTVLDPFCGAGTTGLVAARLGREFVGIELNPDYAEMARKRIRDDMPLFSDVAIECGHGQ